MAGTNPSTPWFNSLVDKGIENIIKNAIEITGGIFHKSAVDFEFKDSGHGEVPAHNALKKMKTFGLIQPSEYEDHYALTDKGWQFETFERERQKASLPVDQMQSVIDTNASVKETNVSLKSLNEATLSNYWWQKRLTIGNILVAVSAVIISTVALFKDDSPEEVRLRKELIRKSQLIDSIMLSQKGIDSSLKILAERSLAKDSATR